MKEIKLELKTKETVQSVEPEILRGDFKKTIDRSEYQNNLTWQKEDGDRTLSIYRNGINSLSLDNLQNFTDELGAFLSKNPISFPDTNLVLTIKNELREAIGEALRRAASKGSIKHEALMSLHEVLSDHDLLDLKQVYGSNYIFQIAKDILKSHHRVDQFEVYETVSDIVGIHEENVRELKDRFVDAFSRTDPITSFILKGEEVVKEIERDLEVLLALAVGDERGFKAKFSEVTSKVKIAEAKRVLAKKSANKCYSFLLGVVSFLVLNLIQADFEIAVSVSAGLGFGYWILTS